MKIAILRKTYTFHGGAEGFSQKLITRLAEAGHEVHLFSIRWEGAPPSERIHLRRVPAPTFNSLVRDASFAVLTWMLLKKESFDIVQSHDKTLYQDIYRAGDGCHIEWLKQRWRRTGLFGKLSIILNPYHWLTLILERLILNGHRFKKIIAISNLVKKDIIAHYKVAQGEIAVIYNGVDLDRFHPAHRQRYRNEIRERHGISPDAFVVLFVGSGFERKGVKYLLRAVDLVPAALTVVIVGKGSPTQLKMITKRQKLVFCGPRRETEQYYAAADAFVFPTMYEPFGNVHLEALASGLPVITTRLSGASEIIEEGRQGFVLDRPEDVGILADRIVTLMKREENDRMSLEARKLAEGFSFDRHVRETMELYRLVKSTA